MIDENVLIYNGYDVCNTFKCEEEIWQDTKDQQRTYDFTERLFEPLIYMMTRGVAVNFDMLNETRIDVQKRIGKSQQALNELCGRELNVNSPKACQQYFYIEKGVEPYYNSKRVGNTYKRSITTDDKAMQRLARGTSRRKGLPEARLVQEIRSLRKMLGTYIDIDFDEDGRFRCSYNPRGTKFGRLSSGKTIYGTGMNMQNLPLEFKQFLVPDPGYFMWEIDKKGAEWVVVAYLSGDANMIRVIEEGLDPHVHTAHLMSNLPKDLIAYEDEVIGHTNDPAIVAKARENISANSPADRHAYENAIFLPRSMTVRQCGKKSNHGLNYDEGSSVFALTNEMLESEAKRVTYMYKHTVYPGINVWHQAIQNKLQTDRTLVNCFGRSMRFLGRWEQKLFKEAYSFIPQSTVVDIVNEGLCKSYEDYRPGMRTTELLGQIHDSILGQTLSNNLLTGARVMQTIGDYLDIDVEYNGREFTIKNELKVGASNWRDLKLVDIYSEERELAKSIGEVINEQQRVN